MKRCIGDIEVEISRRHVYVYLESTSSWERLEAAQLWLSKRDCSFGYLTYSEHYIVLSHQ